jgi:predicted O-methyltransferase YrrM
MIIMKAQELVEEVIQAHLQGKIQILHVEEEITMIANLVAGLCPVNYLEVGYHEGGSFAILSKLCTGKKLVVDVKRHHYPGFDEFMSGEEYEILIGSSQTQEMFEQVRNFCPTYDLIFIDGDHTYDGVSRDFELYKQLLSPKGIMLFHDVDPDHAFADGDAGQVYKFWQELNEGSKTQMVCSSGNGRIDIRGLREHFGGFGIWKPN